MFLLRVKFGFLLEYLCFSMYVYVYLYINVFLYVYICTRKILHAYITILNYSKIIFIKADRKIYRNNNTSIKHFLCIVFILFAANTFRHSNKQAMFHWLFPWVLSKIWAMIWRDSRVISSQYFFCTASKILFPIRVAMFLFWVFILFRCKRRVFVICNKRLAKTSKKWSNLLDMLVNNFFIPTGI